MIAVELSKFHSVALVVSMARKELARLCITHPLHCLHDHQSSQSSHFLTSMQDDLIASHFLHSKRLSDPGGAWNGCLRGFLERLPGDRRSRSTSSSR